jgi:hypothetical protein
LQSRPKKNLIKKNFQRFKKNKKYATHSRHSMTRQLNNDKGLQAQRTERQHLIAPKRNWRFNASYDSFVVKQTLVLRMKFCGEKSPTSFSCKPLCLTVKRQPTAQMAHLVFADTQPKAE